LREIRSVIGGDDVRPTDWEDMGEMNFCNICGKALEIKNALFCCFCTRLLYKVQICQHITLSISENHTIKVFQCDLENKLKSLSKISDCFQCKNRRSYTYDDSYTSRIVREYIDKIQPRYQLTMEAVK